MGISQAPDDFADEATDFESKNHPIWGNRLPVAKAGVDRSVESGTSVTLDGSASSDPEGLALRSYEWTQVSGPEVDWHDNISTSDNVTFTAPVVAYDSPSIEVVFTLTVTDAAGARSTDSVTITVTPPSPVNCYHSSSIGKVGNKPGSACLNMLIVDRAMLDVAVTNGKNSGGRRRYEFVECLLPSQTRFSDKAA